MRQNQKQRLREQSECHNFEGYIGSEKTKRLLVEVCYFFLFYIALLKQSNLKLTHNTISALKQGDDYQTRS